MEKRIYSCDVCGKEVHDKKELKRFFIGIDESASVYNSILKKYELCPECLAKIGIPIEKKEFEEEEKSIQDRLFDIVAEIAQMVQPNNQ